MLLLHSYPNQKDLISINFTDNEGVKSIYQYFIANYWTNKY